MVQERRRVSYIIPSTSNVPRLQLPSLGAARLGAIGPLLLRGDDAPQDLAPRSKHPRHRLGIASLALDTSTQLVGKDAPEGILYSGGRDGLVMSWDLGVPMKRRDNVVGARSRGRWESLTGWEDEGTDDELDDEDEHAVSDGDILGDVSRRRRPSTTADVPHWETDGTAYQPGTVRYYLLFKTINSEVPRRPSLGNVPKHILTG
jgi:WD repeat-containing protein 48